MYDILTSCEIPLHLEFLPESLEMRKGVRMYMWVIYIGSHLSETFKKYLRCPRSRIEPGTLRFKGEYSTT